MCLRQSRAAKTRPEARRVGRERARTTERRRTP